MLYVAFLFTLILSSQAQNGYLVDYSFGNLYRVPLDDPGSAVEIGFSTTFLGCIAFGPEKVLYGLQWTAGDFYSIDATDASVNLIGTATLSPDHCWTGMAFDPSTGLLYVFSSDGTSATSFYTLDMETAETTLIGSTSVAKAIVDIGIEGDGQMYAHHLPHWLYSIDKETGEATLIGNAGTQGAGPWHGMDYDHASETMYMFTYNSTNFENSLRTVNLSTGATTQVGLFDYISSGFAIPYPLEQFPAIEASPEVVAFDSTIVGNVSDQFLTISNSGTAVLEVSEIVSDEISFSVDQASFSVEPGEDVMVTITFSPELVQEYAGTLTIASNEPDNGTITIPVTGTGYELLPALSLMPVELNFDSILVGSSSELSFTVFNAGGATLEVTEMEPTSPDFTVSSPSFNVAPGESMEVETTFTPTEAADYSEILAISSNDPENGIVELVLSGTGYVVSGMWDSQQDGVFTLYPAAPNPFLASTTIRDRLAVDSYVEVVVYNIMGQPVAILVNGNQSKGLKSVTWNRSGRNGKKVGPGLYFLKVQAGTGSKSIKMRVPGI